MKEAVILIGIPGSGKTTYYEQNLRTTHQHVSRDVLGTREKEWNAFRNWVETGRAVAVDDTNVTVASRSSYISFAKVHGYAVRSIYLDTPMRTAIGRNNHRADKKPIPVPAIVRMQKQLERPSEAEGWDRIEIVKSAS